MNKKVVVLVAMGVVGLFVVVSGGALAAKSLEVEQTTQIQVTGVTTELTSGAEVLETAISAEENEGDKLLQYELELPIDWERQRELLDGFTARNSDTGTALTYSSYFALDDQETIKTQLLQTISEGYDSVQILNQEVLHEQNFYDQQLESEHLLLELHRGAKSLLADVFLYRRGDQGAHLIFVNYMDKREEALNEMRDLRECLGLVEAE